jgi:UDP-glucose 4-epimerase
MRVIHNADILIHMASSTVPSSSIHDPVGDIENNVVGTVNLLMQIPNTSIKKVIYFSSGGTVYGNPTYMPVDENHPLAPINPYGISKVACESYLRYYASKFNFQYNIIRPSNPYGPGQPVDGIQGVIAAFLSRVLTGQELKVWGDGTAIRDYIYIEDLIEFVSKLIASDQSGNVFNVGSGIGCDINEIIKVISEISCTSPRVLNMGTPASNVDQIYLDISRARTLIDWEPKFSLKEGIELFYRYMKQEQ